MNRNSNETGGKKGRHKLKKSPLRAKRKKVGRNTKTSAGLTFPNIR